MTCFSKENIYLMFGLGITGAAVAKFLKEQNCNFYVADDNIEKLTTFTIDNEILDEKYKLYELNNKILKEKNINFIILSPHVYAQIKPHKVVKIARRLGINIVPDIDLFYSYLQQYNYNHGTNKKIIAVTGTNGKSTTTSLITFLLNQLGQSAASCGNIGVSMFSLEIEKYNWFVVEMSSCNLFLLKYTKFYSSVLLGIATDHMDYHGTMKNYANSKFKALTVANIKILCIDDKYTQYFKQKKAKKTNMLTSENTGEHYENLVCVSNRQILKNGWSWKDNIFYYNGKEIYNGVFNNLPGEHNVKNILCSVACVTEVLNIADKDVIFEIFKKTKYFQGLPHRIQYIKTIDGIEFVNDSKGTNADSTKMALRTLRNKNIYLIAGGQRKTDGFLSLESDDISQIKYVFLIGAATDSFAEELDSLNIKYKKCYNMENAVLEAFEMAKKDISKLKKNKGFEKNADQVNQNNKKPADYKTIVLLSPLCASFDQYKNFEERGDDFIKIVNSI